MTGSRVIGVNRTMLSRAAARLSLNNRRVQVGLILGLALLLRLGHVTQNNRWSSFEGGDYGWYAVNGRTLVRTGWTFGPPPAGPVFLLVAGYAEQLTPGPSAYGQPVWLLQQMLAGDILFPGAVGSGIGLIRLLYTILGTVTVLMVYRIGRAGWDHTVGVAAGFVVAIGPAFVLEAGNAITESIALLLLTWVTALWMEGIDDPDWRLMAATGGLLGVCALTRSVFLLVPLIPLTHLLLKHGTRRALRHGIMLLAALLVTLSSWTVYNLVQWNRFVIAGEGLLGTLFVGATAWQGPEETDAALDYQDGTNAEDDYAARQEALAQGTLQVILSDPVGYLTRRITSLTGALLQPHNTLFYPGPSIKTLAVDWLRDDRSLSGLWTLTGTESFWPKLLVYLFHYPALLLGTVGLVQYRRRWRDLWPLYALFGYFLGIHLILDVIPRYLFPLEPFWWLFAAAVLVHMAHRRTGRPTPQPDSMSMAAHP